MNNTETTKYRRNIYNVVKAIEPGDVLEARHQREVLNWVDSGEPLCRIAKPDKPPKHLVSYFVVCDLTARQVLLVNHRKAGLWLPTGGHVEPGENPVYTVVREGKEELGTDVEFDERVGPLPVFLTSTVTVGLTAGHTDVSLWFVVRGKAGTMYDYDIAEFSSVPWFGYAEMLTRPISELDPHMHRFMNKLQALTSGG